MTAEAELPPSFGLRLVKTTLRFAAATVGGAQYLLPASATTLSCLRRSVKCFRHEIAFDGYRKFSAESSIFQVESDVPSAAGPRRRAEEIGRCSADRLPCDTLPT